MRGDIGPHVLRTPVLLSESLLAHDIYVCLERLSGALPEVPTPNFRLQTPQLQTPKQVQSLLQEHAASMAAVKAKEARPKTDSSGGGQHSHSQPAGRSHGGGGRGGAGVGGGGAGRGGAYSFDREEEVGMGEDELLDMVFADVPRTIPPEAPPQTLNPKLYTVTRNNPSRGSTLNTEPQALYRKT